MIDHSQAKIFIVDDESRNLRLLDRMLRSQNYQDLTLIEDPREVLPLYKEQQPDLLLLDLNMPHLDGFEVMAQLKELEELLPAGIVVLTAQHGREYLLRALNAGAKDFLTKPFDGNELFARVRNLLDAQLAHRMVQNQKTTLEEMVKQRTEELHHTRLKVVQRLGMAAEYRDEETGNHILRMSHMCELLARSIGWSEEQCDLILNASPMHDIGKIGIPDNILLKPGKLEAHEWEIMKSHAEIGAKLLGDDESSLMTLAREIAMSHHEKWNGTGYPNGLSGEEIPLSGRIAALADVFDALTSERPYKDAWPIGKAVTFIEGQSGVHFDPDLVKVFLAKLPEIVKIKQRFAD